MLFSAGRPRDTRCARRLPRKAKLALVGSGIGLLGALGISRLIVAGFPGLQTSSAPVLAAITVLLLAVAQLACYLPARRAARISPREALRAE